MLRMLDVILAKLVVEMRRRSVRRRAIVPTDPPTQSSPLKQSSALRLPSIQSTFDLPFGNTYSKKNIFS